MRFRPFALAVLGAALSHPAAADLLDDQVGRLLAAHPSIPGVSIAVIDHGMVARAQGYGRTSPDGTAPVTADTLFQAASISKPVTALAALRLVEAGKLSLDTDINQTLTSWRLPDSPLTQTEKVTLRRILSHSAGLTVHGFGGYRVGATLPSLVQILDGVPPANSPKVEVTLLPGSQWRYSGGGYVMLQLAMTDATGEAFPALMRFLVLGPLGMSASGYEQPLPADRTAHAAHGTDSDGEAIPGGWHVYPEEAPAGLWTTPTDLAHYAIGLQELLAGKHPEILSQAMARHMLTRQSGDFGLGIALEGTGESARFSHDGRNDGFDSSMIAFETGGQGAAVMINANDDTRFVRLVVAAIARVYHWPTYSTNAALPPIEDKEPAVTEQVRIIILASQKAAVEPGPFTDQLWQLIAAQQKKGPAKFLTMVGAMKTLTLLKYSEDTQSRRYLYRAVFEGGDMLVSVAFQPDGKIAGFLFKPL